MKVVLLAGGKGTRISEESRFRPKPMIEIGGKPIIWHIMKEYSHFGYNEFIICAGYMQDYIKEWFGDYFTDNCDVTYDYTGNELKTEVHEAHIEPWRVTIVDTGLNTMTGGRVKRIQKYIGDETFMLTYGDGVCDVDISKLVACHKESGKTATLTAVLRAEEKGVLDIDENNSVRSFREKSSEDKTPINAGYMVLEPKIFDYIDGDETIFERDVLQKLADEGELMSYTHKGYWQCMDSERERVMLENIFATGKAPWVYK